MEATKKDEQWRKRIGEYRASGMTMKAWCVKQGIAFSQMKYWIRKLKLSTRQRSTSPTTWIIVTPSSETAMPEHAPLIIRIGGASIDVRPGYGVALPIRRAYDSVHCVVCIERAVPVLINMLYLPPHSIINKMVIK